MDRVPDGSSCPVDPEDRDPEPGSGEDGSGLGGFFGDLAGLPVEVEERRPTCSRCRRPVKVCLCPFLPVVPLEVSTCLYVVQHPAEESRVLRTVPLLAACLPHGKCHVIVGRRFNQERNPELAAVCRDRRTLILYPGPNSQNLEELLQREQEEQQEEEEEEEEEAAGKYNVILIDGTWSQAKNMFLKNSLFHLPRQVQLQRSLSSQYVIRTQPSNMCLSTLESAAVALSVLERNDHILEVLLRPLRALCSFQLQHGAQIHHSKEQLLQRRLQQAPPPRNTHTLGGAEPLPSHHSCPR